MHGAKQADKFRCLTSGDKLKLAKLVFTPVPALQDRSATAESNNASCSDLDCSFWDKLEGRKVVDLEEKSVF
eukprot:5981235-Amphidinium_carterae.1